MVVATAVVVGVAATQTVEEEAIAAVVVGMVQAALTASSVDVLGTGLESARLEAVAVAVAVVNSLHVPGSVVMVEGAAVGIA